MENTEYRMNQVSNKFPEQGERYLVLRNGTFFTVAVDISNVNSVDNHWIVESIPIEGERREMDFAVMEGSDQYISLDKLTSLLYTGEY